MNNFIDFLLLLHTYIFLYAIQTCKSARIRVHKQENIVEFLRHVLFDFNRIIHYETQCSICLLCELKTRD